MKKETYDAMAREANLILTDEERAILDKFQKKLGFKDREVMDLLIVNLGMSAVCFSDIPYALKPLSPLGEDAIPLVMEQHLAILRWGTVLGTVGHNFGHIFRASS